MVENAKGAALIALVKIVVGQRHYLIMGTRFQKLHSLMHKGGLITVRLVTKYFVVSALAFQEIRAGES
ncbi:hypothetical protein [uncultured Thiodictyon sp.]|jgi:hypothetical protein|uniref:hypothetical protein n=1 Tax=uncultured Thiodictyon sp. TaxID=1846217 RepID=UPI0025D9EFA3|nr:hypothetical protein [uncultured Thiodictyon sp.]